MRGAAQRSAARKRLRARACSHCVPTRLPSTPGPTMSRSVGGASLDMVALNVALAVVVDEKENDALNVSPAAPTTGRVTNAALMVTLRRLL
jgi:hypothetical protein